MHNHLSTEIKNKIENIGNKKENNSIIPYISYEQLFKTLKIFLEKNVCNTQLQTVIKQVYKEYLNDNNLGDIKDKKGEVIKETEGNIKFLLKDDEINEVKGIFSNIENFENFCNINSLFKSYN